MSAVPTNSCCAGCFWLAEMVDPVNGLPWCAHRYFHGHIYENRRRCIDGFKALEPTDLELEEMRLIASSLP